MSRLLTAEDVRDRYGWRSLKPVWHRTSHNLIPHIKRAGDRRCYFNAEWLDAWEAGAELEVVELQGGGRMVRPKAAA